MSLFKRANSFSATTQRIKRKLPPNYFEDLLEHEMLVYTRYSIQYLKELIELYSVQIFLFYIFIVGDRIL